MTKMVAFYDDCDRTEHPKTLSDWVRNFRLKRVQMRRKLRGAAGDLRVSAILSTALLHAEQELRRKQQERFSRWIDIQAKFTPRDKTHCVVENSNTIDNYQSCDDTNIKRENEQKRREVENNLWRSELSGLDDFMRSLSSKNININGNSSSYNTNQRHCPIIVHS